jgi:hypothetical protein
MALKLSQDDKAKLGISKPIAIEPSTPKNPQPLKKSDESETIRSVRLITQAFENSQNKDRASIIAMQESIVALLTKPQEEVKPIEVKKPEKWHIKVVRDKDKLMTDLIAEQVRATD